MNPEYQESLERGRREWGDRFDTVDLDSAHSFFARFYHGPRVKVQGPMGTRTGVVSRTTGWRPAFLLMHRSNAHGSRDVIGDDDRIVAVQVKRRYMTITPYSGHITDVEWPKD